MSDRPNIPFDSRAVLIGVPDYQDARYTSYPSVGNSIVGMYELLVHSGLCGWSEDQVIKIINPGNAGQLLKRLRQIARGTTGVLLLYFVGHGVISEQGDLCLAISDTDADSPDFTGIEYAKIKWMLYRETAATTRIVFLDCCYSGRAIGLGSPAEAQLADLSEVKGVYTLTAADELADASSGIGDVRRTAFTGELLDLLIHDGIPGRSAGLTLGDIYPQLHNRLASKGLPKPNQRADDHAAAFVFARNTAGPPGSGHLSGGINSSAQPTVAADQVGQNCALLIWRRAGRVLSDMNGRLFGDTGQGEDVQFAADRMYWPCADWREPSLKAEIIIVDGKIQRIREVYGIDRAATLDASSVALRVSPPLEPDAIKSRLPTLPFTLGDELPAVRGKRCEYRSYPDPKADQAEPHVMRAADGQGSPSMPTPDSRPKSGSAIRSEIGTSIDVFTGCGGLALAMHQTGLRHLLTVERDKQACSTLLRNAATPYSPHGPDPASLNDPWPLVSADVTAVDFSRWTGAVDVVAGTVPYQPRSLASAEKGRTDPRNPWPELFRCVRETRPLAVVAVSSRDLLRPSVKPYTDYLLREFAAPFEPQVDHADWRDRDRRLQKALSRPGGDLTERYDVQFQLMNAADYGVPQVSWRIVVVAFRRDLGLGNWSLPQRTHSETALRQYQESGEYWARHRIRSPVLERHTTGDTDPCQPWVTLRDAISNLPAPTVGSEPVGLLHHRGQPGAHEYAGHNPDELDRPARTVTASKGVVRLDDGSLRYLSVREIARITTFPDYWALSGQRPEQMRQLGDAVPVALARTITESIAEALRERLRSRT